MATAQEQLDSLDAMIASGVLRTQFDGHMVQYQSTAELLQARAALAGRIAAQSATGRVRHTNPAYDSGL